MKGFSARERGKLVQDLADEMYDLIHEHGSFATLTVAEVLGALELLKFELITEIINVDDEDEES